jgi:ParB family chromosome partitioning protein
MQLIQLETIEVPFRKLVASTENVRTTPAEEEATRQLAASIQAVGLLQSLVVQPAARGKFAVVAGERRYSALTLLHEAGQLPKSFKIPCRLLPKGADTTEVSLAENVERETMDALDECLAFQRLASNGKSIADIALRFGYSEMLIERRLALARLSPALIEQYRKGSANLDLLQAFTLTSDHSLQEQVWTQLPEWNRNPATVRRLLSDKDIPASDPQVRFVTLAAYEAAGGQTKRDLFADEDGNGVFVTDPDLLTRLVNEKLQQTAAATQSEGWRWVEIHPDADYSTLAKFRRIPGEPEPLPRKLEAKRKTLQKELGTLTQQLDGQEEETEDLEEIEDSRPVSYPETVKQSCGVIVSLDQNGQARIHPGLLRKDDEAAIRASREDRSDGEASNDQTDGIREPEAGYSAALIQSLTTVKTAAIAAELAQQPRIALATVVYTMILQEFSFELDCYNWHSSLQLSMTQPDLREAEDSAPGKALSELRQSLRTQLPAGAELWKWCLGRSEETLLSFLAFVTAKSVNAFRSRVNPITPCAWLIPTRWLSRSI